MIIIGEKLNSSIPSAYQAFESGDNKFIIEMAEKQIKSGADYIDVNAGLFTDEAEKLVWAISNIQASMDAKIVIDSTNPKSIEYVFENINLKDAIINSTTLEKERLEGILPLVVKYNTGIIALPIGQDGIPDSAQKRVENADALINKIKEQGIAEQKIYIDILVEAASAQWQAPRRALEAAYKLREKYPEIHLISGLSNVSFGLPNRRQLNSAFLSAAITAGVDTVIMDITNNELKMALYSASLVNGQDEYCVEYISAYREIFE